ncbi:DUF3102 domain-containing protein [Tolypothrix campylonemoides VB511288]|nr:DUF3102 domain-containing protein [Tolypothrix campylonemoides VB511288]
MNRNDLPSKLLDELPKQTLKFEYSVLEAQTQRVVQQRTNEIKALMRRNSQDIIDIGQKLIEVKQHLGHGSFRNWLKFEFNWSVSAATKFMQVAQQFKCVNFTHLNITASTLYLIAAPSTPKHVREEVLKRASNGENISYTKAKAIVSQHKKTASLKSDKSLNVIEPTGYEITSAISAQEHLTEKDAITQTRSLLPQESLPSMVSENKQIATTVLDTFDDTTQTPTSTENQVAISHETSDAAIAQMAVSIKNLTPEQLARVILKAVNKGLSEYQLSAIITASQQALNIRQQDQYSN